MLRLFALETPLLEIILRGSCMYLGLIVLSRFFLRRESGVGSVSDMLVVVLLADASQNAMAGEYRTITDGLVLVSTILAWSYLIDWLSYRLRFVERLIRPRPLLIVKDGKLIHHNMRKELITRGELLQEMRAEGIERLHQVAEARMEGNGQISFIKRE